MKKIFQLAQILQNLNRIKRTGGNLFMGVPEGLNVSVAEHSYAVAYLSLLFADKLKSGQVNKEKLLGYCLVHDWTDSIIGDLPAGSPSWASFWQIDIRKEASQAEEKAFKAIMNLIKNEVDIAGYQKI